MASKKLTILFTPLDAWGHVNPEHGIAGELKKRGHRVVFALDKSFKGVLAPYGFEEIILKSVGDEDEEFWVKQMEKTAKYTKDGVSIVTLEHFVIPGFKLRHQYNIDNQDQYKEIINNVKPDVIITDQITGTPYLNNSTIPWVWIMPAAPQFYLDDDRLPPFWSGLPLNGDREEWKKFKQAWNVLIEDVHNKVNEFFVTNGCQPLNAYKLHPISPHLNVMYWPKEMFYEEVMPLPDNWIRVDNILRITNQTFEVPKQLTQRPGKLILLSMGSIGCSLDIMIKLTTILAKSEHKFIVSKGPAFESHELPDNMWGQRFLPQTAIYPLVDLVITHGGNNSFNEIFYHGKPMLVLPLFCDQLDNAQRVSETGLGLRLNPYHLTESELLSAVDRLVSDKALAERMTAIGHRIRNTNDKKLIAERIEQIFD